MPDQANGTPELLPRPDPTVLTTEQLRREISSLRSILETRLDSMDKATVLLHDDVLVRLAHVGDGLEARFQAVDAASQARSEVRDEKLHSVQTRLEDFAEEVAVRFSERDTRSEREARDNKIAVDAAFAAAKEAVAENNKSSALATDKSEAGFTKQIDQLTLLIETRAKASDDKIDDIKEQLSNRRGHEQGGVDARTFFFAIAGLIIAVISAAALIGAHL